MAKEIAEKAKIFYLTFVIKKAIIFISVDKLSQAVRMMCVIHCTPGPAPGTLVCSKVNQIRRNPEMKKLLVLALALILALGCVSALAEESHRVRHPRPDLKYDDTYGSSVRQAMKAAAEEIGAELGITIQLTMYTMRPTIWPSRSSRPPSGRREAGLRHHQPGRGRFRPAAGGHVPGGRHPLPVLQQGALG